MSAFREKIADSVDELSNSTRPSDTKKIASLTDTNLFSITGGPVLVKAIIGNVTTAAQASTNNAKITYRADTDDTDRDLCATTNLTGTAAGSIITINGVRTDALKVSTLKGVGEINDTTTTRVVQVLGPGTIKFDGSATTTGAIEFNVLYEPVTPGARVIPV